MTQSGRHENADAVRAPVCWTITDGKPGMESQCLGLAEAVGLPVVGKRIAVRAPWRWLPPRLWLLPLRAPAPQGDRLEPPWPELVIASGRQSVAPAAAIRFASGGRTICIQIQTPRIDPRRFDLVVVPRHDRLRGENVVPTQAALHRITPRRLAEASEQFAPLLAHLPRPLVAVLVGGTNRDYRLAPPVARRLGEQLAAMAATFGAGLAVTTSRRTGEANAAALRQGIGETVPLRFWDQLGENPYFGFLALADAIVVTADSVSMVSEACSTGKPVYVVPLPGRSAKLEEFHERLRAAGITRPFDGTLDRWRYQPLDDTARVAAIVRELVAKRRAGSLSSLSPAPPRAEAAPWGLADARRSSRSPD